MAYMKVVIFVRSINEKVKKLEIRIVINPGAELKKITFFNGEFSKELLDCGAITQDEFNEKKKQLLSKW